MLSRCIFLGALNGWPTLTGVVCAEIGGDTGQPALLSKVIAAGGVFGLIGPAIGGWTYGQISCMPPALPPNIVGAVMCLAAMALVHVWLHPSEDQKSTAAPGTVAASGGGGDRMSTCSAMRTFPLPVVITYRAMAGLVMYMSWDVFPLFCIASTDVGGIALDAQARP